MQDQLGRIFRYDSISTLVSCLHFMHKCLHNCLYNLILAVGPKRDLAHLFSKIFGSLKFIKKLVNFKKFLKFIMLKEHVCQRETDFSL